MEIDVEAPTVIVADLLAGDVDVGMKFPPQGLRVGVILCSFGDVPIAVHFCAVHIADDHMGIPSVAIGTGGSDGSGQVGGPKVGIRGHCVSGCVGPVGKFGWIAIPAMGGGDDQGKVTGDVFGVIAAAPISRSRCVAGKIGLTVRNFETDQKEGRKKEP